MILNRQPIKYDFPNVRIHGCSFHLSTIFKKQVGQLNLTTRYNNNDADFSISVKIIVSLAFVKLVDINLAIDL